MNDELLNKRILYIVKGDVFGGAEKIIFDLAFHFKNIVGYLAVASLEDKVKDRFIEKGIPFYSLYFSRLPKIAKVIHFILSVPKYIRANSINIIQTPHRIYLPLLNFLQCFLKFRIIYSAVNTFYDYKGFICRADSYTALSSAVYTNLTSYYRIAESKVVLIHHGINQTESNSVVSIYKIRNDNSLVIGYAGRFVKEKGIKYLLEAISRIKNSNIQLIIKGCGPLKVDLEKRIKKYGINELVIFEKWESDLSLFWSKIDLLILPSIKNEGLGLILLEAMQKERMIIASDLDGIKDRIKNNWNGFLFEPGSVNDLYEKINFVISGRYDVEMIHNSKKTMQEFNIIYTFKKFEQLYFNIGKNVNNINAIQRNNT